MPDSPEVADTLGWVYYKRDVLDLAVESLEQSVAKDPKNATYQVHLGLAYAKAGLRTKAQSALERALQLDPNVESAGDARRALADLRS
jgi:tetratricopeptide (TPR) repeat protein